jgi:hypothetical protein
MFTYKDNNYLIEFFSRAILYLSKKYPNIKSSINATIKFDVYEKYQKGIVYNGTNKKMALITNGDGGIPLMEIQIDNIRQKKFKFNSTEYSFETPQKIEQPIPLIPFNNLFLSSNDESNMFHSYLYKLELTYNSNDKYTFGVKNYINTDIRFLMMVRDGRINTGLNTYWIVSYGQDDILKSKSMDGNLEEKDFDLEGNEYVDIITLYSQENTDYRFIEYKKDYRYNPSLVKINGTFAIRFFRKSLLKAIVALDQYDIKASKLPISNITKISAIINIDSRNCDFASSTESYQCKYATEIDNIENYMDLLASKKSSIITLDLNKPNKYDNNGLEYKIVNKLNTNKEKINHNVYNGESKTSINVDIDDPSLIECLGVVHDIRSDNDIRWDPAFKGKKDVRDDYIKKHAFIGYLYDLTIYKKDI